MNFYFGGKIMEKIYYEDQYLKEFVAEITEIVDKNNLYYIKLDKTAFFPGGGGQHCDLGYIDNHKVINVIEENGKIYVFGEDLKTPQKMLGIDYNSLREYDKKKFKEGIKINSMEALIRLEEDFAS